MHLRFSSDLRSRMYASDHLFPVAHFVLESAESEQTAGRSADAGELNASDDSDSLGTGASDVVTNDHHIDIDAGVSEMPPPARDEL
jgi:hypothetical protein